MDNRAGLFRSYFEPRTKLPPHQTIVSVSEPRGGRALAWHPRFEPTRGEGVDRRGGGRIYKVEMTEQAMVIKLEMTKTRPLLTSSNLKEMG